MGKIEKIASDLEKRLEAGEFPVGSRFPSETELADKFSVNKTTASKVVAMLAARGFVKRSASRAGTTVLRGKRFLNGHLLYLTSLGHPFFSALLDGAQFGAFQAGYFLNVLSPKNENMDFVMEQIRASDALGILCSTYPEVSVPGIPTLFVDRMPVQGNPFNSVNSDNAAGGCLIGRELLAKGHRNAVFMTTLVKSIRGRAVMESMGLDENRIFTVGGSEFEFASGLRRAFEMFPALTAVACERDDDAWMVLKCLNGLGVDPASVAVAGFGNVAQIQNLSPFLTIDQHPFEMGTYAAKRLVGLVEKKDDGPVCDFLNLELVNRQFLSRAEKNPVQHDLI